MKYLYKSLIVFFLSQTIVFTEVAQEISTYDGKKVRIPAARLEMTAYGWTYFVDKAAINAFTESALQNMRMTDAEAKSTMNTSFVAFFLFEPEDRILNAFRTNINMVVESGLKMDLGLAEYARLQAKNIELLLKDARVIDVQPAVIQNDEFYRIEYVFDTPEPQPKTGYLRCHGISYSILIDGKGYVFTAVATEKDFKLKKPAILKTLGSLKRTDQTTDKLGK